MGSNEEKVAKLRKEFTDTTTSLINKGILNEEFIHVQSLQDEESPKFLAEIVNIFLEELLKVIQELAKLLLDQENLDFKTIHNRLHSLKSSSCTLGAQKVLTACNAFLRCCDERNIEGCYNCLQHVLKEYLLVKPELEGLLKLEEQIVAAGGSIPKPDLK